MNRQKLLYLARVASNDFADKNKPIFDPLKDFMSMNRSMRRQFTNERPKELKPICCDTDYKKIEIVAIYQ